MNTTVMQISGDDLNNYYSPKNDTVSLSATVYNSSSLSSLGVAAHEVGHAIQHNEHYLPVKIRTALAPAVTFMSSMAMPLIIIGLILEIFIFAATDSPIGIFIIMAGVVFYGSYAVFAFITLPVEFNASNRALVILSSSGTLTDKELKGAKKVLSAAAMTYVAAFLTSIIQFIRLLLRLVIILQATKRR
jgi:Zn-dependent membrane protease YugP